MHFGLIKIPSRGCKVWSWFGLLAQSFANNLRLYPWSVSNVQPVANLTLSTQVMSTIFIFRTSGTTRITLVLQSGFSDMDSLTPQRSNARNANHSGHRGIMTVSHDRRLRGSPTKKGKSKTLVLTWPLSIREAGHADNQMEIFGGPKTKTITIPTKTTLARRPVAGITLPISMI